MRIEDAVAQKLLELLCDYVDDRVFQDGLPLAYAEGGVWPCVMFQHATDTPLFYLNGGRSDLEIDTFSIEIWSPNRDEVGNIRDAIREGFQGRNAAGYWGVAPGLLVWGAYATEFSGDATPKNQGGEELDKLERLSIRVVWKRG